MYLSPMYILRSSSGPISLWRSLSYPCIPPPLTNPLHPQRNLSSESHAAAAAAKSFQSCPTLCYPIDGSPPGSTVPGILQARTLEWVAISFSNAGKWKVKVKLLSPVQLLVTPRLQHTRLLRPWDFPGKSTGVGCHCLLQYLHLLYAYYVFNII